MLHSQTVESGIRMGAGLLWVRDSLYFSQDEASDNKSIVPHSICKQETDQYRN